MDAEKTEDTGGPAGPETADAESEREQELSLQRIEQGGIPLAAERRLGTVEKGAGAFTSDLSVADFALCRQLGLRPVSQVSGTSIYQVGFQPVGWGMTGELGELEVLSQAWNEARERAFGRLVAEARSVGADAVVGVSVRSALAGWTESAGNGAIEYVACGTAVDRSAVARHDAKSRDPVITELSVADYAKLLAAGVEPVGVVAWTSVLFISSIYFQAEREERGLGGALGTGAFGGGTFRNFEYEGATQGFYEARERVTEQLGLQAQALGASGVVGVRIGHTCHAQTVGGGTGRQRSGLIVSFSAIGTAVLDTDEQPPAAPQPTVDLTT